MKKILLYFISFVFIVSNIFYINVYATEESANAENIEQQQAVQNIEQVQNVEEKCLAEVKKIGEIKDSEQNENEKIQEVTLQVMEGQYKDKEVTANYIISNGEKYEKYQLQVGDEVNVIIFGDFQGNLFITIQSVHRTWCVFLILVSLLIAIFLLYGKHSIKPILSITLTILLIYFFLFKLVVNSKKIIFLTILFGIILTIIESIINNGFNKKIWISLIGTIGGVLCSLLFSVIFIYLERINVNNIGQISFNTNYNKLMSAGTIIISFVACMNLAIHIIINLDSSKIATKDAYFKDLFKLGIIHGQHAVKEFISIIVTTFIGIFFGIICIYSSNHNQLLNVFSQDFILSGIISVVAACIGSIISIPITASFYALINGKKTRYKTTSENKVDGKRSLKI